MYATRDDIEKKRIPTDILIELTDDEGLDLVCGKIVDWAIQDASVLFETYIRGRYNLPLNPVPALARTIVADLAAYELFSRRPSMDIPKTIQDRRDSALALLARIQDGKMPLFDSTSRVETVYATGQERLFTRDKLRGM